MNKNKTLVKIKNNYNYYFIGSDYKDYYNCSKCCFSVGNQFEYRSCCAALRSCFEKQYLSCNYFSKDFFGVVLSGYFKKEYSTMYDYIVNNVKIGQKIWTRRGEERIETITINECNVIIKNNTLDEYVIVKKNIIYPFSFVSKEDYDENIKKINEYKEKIKNIANKFYIENPAYIFL